MALSFQEVVSDGNLSVLLIEIDYFDRDDIAVYFDDVPNAYPWAWVGVTEKVISFTPDVPAGVVVQVRRSTDMTGMLHKFSSGAAFTSGSMDDNFKQVLQIAQEAREGGWGESAQDIKTELAASTGSLLVGHTPDDGPVTSVGAELVQHELDLVAINSEVDALTAAVAAEFLLSKHYLANYTALRAYAGPHTSLYIEGFSARGDGGAGTFRYDSTDTTSADNGGTIIVDASNRRWKREFTGPVVPRWFGAVGDGTADDTTAITSALASGLAVFGERKTYAVSGNLALPAGTTLLDIAFKQLSPAGGSRRTLYANGVSNITLRRVTVNRNGSGANGTMTDDAGIWITGGSGHILEDVEVYGNDIGNGLVIVNASRFQIVRPYMHDIKYVLGSSPGDDRVQGIWIQGCTDWTMHGQSVRDLGGNFGSGDTTRYSRGITVGGSQRFTIGIGIVRNVDQGYDVTGGDGNFDYIFNGAHAYACYSYGFKSANTPVYGTYVGCIARDCGYAGFVVNGAAGATAVSARNITFIGCRSINSGYNGAWTANDPTGFLILQGAFLLNNPRPVRFINCEAVDEQTVKTMKYGFRNQVVGTATGQQINECIHCISENHTVAAFSGFGYPGVRVKRTAAQSIPNNASTNITWDTEVFDGAFMHSTSSNTDIVNVPRAGWYKIKFKATFQHNGAAPAGIRLVQISINGAQNTDSVAQDVGPGNDLTLSTDVTLFLNPSDNITAQVYQNSGGSINVLHTSSFLEVMEAMPYSN